MSRMQADQSEPPAPIPSAVSPLASRRQFPPEPSPKRLSASHFPDFNNNGSVVFSHAARNVDAALSRREHVHRYTAMLLK